MEKGRDTLLYYGKEICDLIIGSDDALSAFFTVYNEWADLRHALIEQFEQLEKDLLESSKKYDRYSDIIKVVDAGVIVASAVSPAFALGSKIVNIISSLISKFISTSDKTNANADEPEITVLMYKDIDRSSALHMYALQCNLQFQETTKLIEEFHSNINIREFSDCDDPDITNFIRNVLEYKPKHRVFYKKFHKSLLELIQNDSSSFGRRFCEPFLLYSSSAVNVVEFLDWQFVEDYDNSSVKHELEGIQRLIQSSSTTVTELRSKIKSCIGLLSDELMYVKRSVAKVSLFTTSCERTKFKAI